MAMREAIAVPSSVLLLAPVASGILQSLVQAANSQVGQRGASVVWILGGASIIGSLWGLFQLHLVAGLVYLFTSATGDRVPFGRLRTVFAVAYAPLAAALVGWLAATVLLGPGLYTDPATLVSRYGPGTALEVSLLYLATVACFGWSMVLQVVGLAEARQSSLSSALGTWLASIVLGAIAISILIVIVIVIVVLLR